MKKWLTRHFFGTSCLLHLVIVKCALELFDLAVHKHTVFLNIAVGCTDIAMPCLVTCHDHALLIGEVTNTAIFQ